MKGVFRENNKFWQDITVPCYDVDRDRRLRPAAFMDMAQELAHWGAELIGAGYDALSESHTAWVLSRMHIHFADTPLWKEDIRLWTWHKGFDGLFFLRDFLLEDASGRTRVAATSSWLIIDTESRRLLRNPAENPLLDFSTAGEGAAIAEPAPKVQAPAGAAWEPAGSHTVAYSDLDFLGHVNNARYMAWAMDSLGLEDASRPPVDICINFNREVRPGDTVQLFRCREILPDGHEACYVEGQVESRQSFIVKMEY